MVQEGDEDEADEEDGGEEQGSEQKAASKSSTGSQRYRVSQAELLRLGTGGKKAGSVGVSGIYPPGRPKVKDTLSR